MISDGRIEDFVTGDDLEIERTITAVPSGTIIETAWFMVKRKFTDVDDDAIISKLINDTNQIGIGWIQDTGSDTTGLVRFYLTPADTSILTALSEYPYSIKLKFSNGKVNTPELGVIVAFPAVKQGST